MAKEVDKLSDAALRHLVRAGKPAAIADGGGLTFTLSAAGTASWVLRYRHNRRARELTLGRYPDLSLKSARERARNERASVQSGIDVAEKRQKDTMAAATAMTFAALIDDYAQKKMPTLAPTTRKQRHQQLNTHVRPAIGSIPVRSIGPEDIAAMLRRVGKTSTPHVAELVLTVTSEVFKHGQRTSAATINPCVGLSAFAIVGRPTATRQRLMLDEVELRTLLPQLNQIGRVNQLAVLILLTTCARLGELARAEWDEIDLIGGFWTIPLDHSKTGRAFKIPLVQPVLQWFHELQVMACGSRFVLPARQLRRQQTHGKEMHFEQRALNAMLHKLTERVAGIRRFTPHDLRSTARSHLSALGVNVVVAERCLNHTLGGLIAIYDQHDYLDERRQALQKLADFVLSCELKHPISQVAQHEIQ